MATLRLQSSTTTLRLRPTSPTLKLRVARGLKGDKGDPGPAGEVEGPDTSVAHNLAAFSDTSGSSLEDSGVAVSTDGTFASDSDAKLPTEKAVKSYVDSHGAVTSVFGRSGAVAAQASDYAASEIDNDSSVSGSTVKDALETLDAKTFAASDITNDSSVSGSTTKDALETLDAKNTFPTIKGGTGAGSGLELRSTSGAGSGDYVKVTGGNNGGTEIARFLSTQQLILGDSVARGANAPGTQPGFQVHGSGGVPFAGAAVYRWSNDAGGPFFFMLKSRNATIGSHTSVQSGDGSGGFIFNASDGTAFIPVANIQAMVDGTPGTNDMPGRLVFATTADGANTATERLRIDNAGQLIHRANATVVIDANSHLGLRSYTVATLPSASTAGRLIYVSDGTSNKRLAVSDGTNWRWPDGAVVS